MSAYTRGEPRTAALRRAVRSRRPPVKLAGENLTATGASHPLRSARPRQPGTVPRLGSRPAVRLPGRPRVRPPVVVKRAVPLDLRFELPHQDLHVPVPAE